MFYIQNYVPHLRLLQHPSKSLLLKDDQLPLYLDSPQSSSFLSTANPSFAENCSCKGREWSTAVWWSSPAGWCRRCCTLTSTSWRTCRPTTRPRWGRVKQFGSCQVEKPLGQTGGGQLGGPSEGDGVEEYKYQRV